MKQQLGLALDPSPAPPPLRFNGEAYVPQVDQPRLAGQHEKLREFLLDRPGRWFTLAELGEALHEPPASLSAQLRHLRKPRFGHWHTPKRRRGEAARGLFEYTILPAEAPCAAGCPARCGKGRDHHGGA